VLSLIQISGVGNSGMHLGNIGDENRIAVPGLVFPESFMQLGACHPFLGKT
jgi:hypothetical protein